MQRRATPWLSLVVLVVELGNGAAAEAQALEPIVRIQRATGGEKSLGDVMKQAYKLFGGERGFTPLEFRLTAQDIAGVDLKEWFRKNVASTEELD